MRILPAITVVAHKQRRQNTTGESAHRPYNSRSFKGETVKLGETIIGFGLVLLNIAAGLVMLGLLSHLSWYCIAFGWFLLP
jgi:hypothetical protein